MFTFRDYQDVLANAVKSFELASDVRSNNDVTRRNASASICALAGVEGIAKLRNNSDAVTMLDLAKKQLGDDFSRFKQTLYQARKCVDHFPDALAIDWGKGKYMDSNSLGTMYKTFLSDNGKLPSKVEKLIKTLESLHSDDLHTIANECSRLQARRQSVMIKKGSYVSVDGDSDTETDN